MTAPLDLVALKAKALSVVADGWYEERDIGCLLDVDTDSDARFIIAASPATMLELLARLATAEAEAVHYRGVANDVRRQQLGAMPESAPVYDPSLQVPAEIVAAANMVSTWAAKQNRGSWRIGNVCSADFGNQDELARLRSNVAILSAQSEALHLVGHELGLPAGTDVVRDVLPKVKHLVMVRNLLTRGPMPGHVTLTVATERDGVPFTTLKVISKAKAASERTYSEFRISAMEFESMASQAFVEADNFLNAGGAQ